MRRRTPLQLRLQYFEVENTDRRVTGDSVINNKREHVSYFGVLLVFFFCCSFFDGFLLNFFLFLRKERSGNSASATGSERVVSGCSDIFSTHGIVWILFNSDVLWPKIKFNEKWLRCVSGSRLYFTIGGVRNRVSKSAVQFFFSVLVI